VILKVFISEPHEQTKQETPISFIRKLIFMIELKMCDLMTDTKI